MKPIEIADVFETNQLVVLETSFVLASGFLAFWDFCRKHDCLDRVIVPSPVRADLKARTEIGVPVWAGQRKRIESIYQIIASRQQEETPGGEREREQAPGNKVGEEAVRMLIVRWARTQTLAVLTRNAGFRVRLDHDLIAALRSGQPVQPVMFCRLVKSSPDSKKLHLVADAAENLVEPRPGLLKRCWRRLLSGFRAPPHPVLPRMPVLPLQPGEVVIEKDDDREPQWVLCQEMGFGGEGTIFIAGHQNEEAVCKIYTRGVDSGEEDNLRQKLEAMMRKPPQGNRFAWPRALVWDTNGRFRGFLMARLPGEKLSDLIDDPVGFLERHPTWSRADSIRVCLKLLAALEHLRGLGYLFADLKPENFLLDGQTVYVVDCDSLQFDHYPCPVGDERFLSPRLAKLPPGPLPGREKRDEAFAVAVLVFLILMNGIHPYQQRGGAGYRQNILNGKFPYDPDGTPTGREPSGEPRGVCFRLWSQLPRKLRQTFAAAFDPRTWDQAATTKWNELLRRYLAVVEDPERSYDSSRQIYDRNLFPLHVRPQNSDE